MSDLSDNLINLVTPYGLSAEEATVYLWLLRHGAATALTLSRNLHLARTKVYRVLDKLRNKQLIEQQLADRGLTFAATSPQKFTQLVEEQKQKLATLTNSLPQLITQLTQTLPAPANHSKVIYYEGLDGIRQVSYNITRADGLLRVYEMEHLSEFIPVKVAENIRAALVERQILTRDLTNKTKFPGFTDVTGMIPAYSQFRHLNPRKLKINFEVIIYNDVYATYTYKSEKIFAVEIYNPLLAAMQKQIFDHLWVEAKPMHFTDSRGAAQI